MASIWAIAEGGKFLRQPSRAPVQLMTTDSSLWSLLAAKNTIFYAGDKEVRELARYDVRSKQFVPFLPGLRARDVDFSRDGQWVAYVVPTMQETILWRSRVDGSDRQQLTFPPMHAYQPRWSPDGKKIAFAGTLPGKRGEVFLIPPGGGEPEPVTPSGLDSSFPDWCPGGDVLVFSAPVRASGGLLKGENGGTYQLDLRTRRLSVFPGAEALLFPRWSPDGRYLAALTVDQKLMLFDSRARAWSGLAHGKALRPARWSPDSKYAYSQDVEGSQPIFRVRISDRKVEPITTFEEILRADVRSYALAAVAPDGSPVVSLILSHSDIYALDLKFP
jgi:Tol biopolymer transport system component